MTPPLRPTDHFDDLRALEARVRRLEAIPGNKGTPLLASQFFTPISFDNLFSTSYVEFYQQNSIGVAPTAVTMVVVVIGRVGFTGSDNNSQLDIRDQSGASILIGNDASNYVTANRAAKWGPVALVGKKQYAAGATMGFRLAYKVDLSNLYTRLGVQVDFLLGAV